MNIKAKDIINALYNPDDIVNIRIFSDRNDPLFAKGKNIEVVAAQFSTKEELLKEHNANFRAITVVVNTGGRSDKDITKINAQFMEKDDIPIEEQKKLIDAFPLKPSMIIKTRKSLHTYWFMKNAKVELFKPIQHALVEYFGADSNCENESRAMRLPGFNHCKQEPIEVECISFHPELRYTQEELMKYLPEIKITKKPTQILSGKEQGIDIVLEGCEFIKHCINDAKTLSEHDWYAMISNLAPFDNGGKTIHELSKPYPNYDYDSTQNKINHFIESGTKPITCKVIAEKGFKCPKLAIGGCDCKSPAALCYKPIAYEILKKKLDELAIKEDTVENVEECNNYICKYLFNQDPTMAETFINHNIKNKFKFKTPEIKTLINKYKELIKENNVYKDNSRIQNNTATEYAWYKKTKYGKKFMPKVLAKNLKKSENVFFVAQQFYKYVDGVYKTMDDDRIEEIVQSKLFDEDAKSSQISDATHQWRLMVLKEMKELNPNPYILNLKNGLFNIFDGILAPHTPEYLSIVQLNMAYDPEAKCPIFMRYLEESLDGDMEQVKLVQEILGYFMIASQSAQKAFVIVGKANSGKSVLLNVINEVIFSKEYVSHIAWQNLGDRFKTAELYGKMANVFGDLPSTSIEDNGVFKALVGQDYLTVEKKNKDPFSFQSYARMIFSCNEIPKNYGDKSEGFYRRLIIIRFDKVIPMEKRDTTLLDKIKNESDGIFNFALEGLKRVIQNNYVFSETEKNKKELQKYREDSDSVLSFIKEMCEVNSKYNIRANELFNAYKDYCKENGLKNYAQNNFATKLQNYSENITKSREGVSKMTVYHGIRLID